MVGGGLAVDFLEKYFLGFSDGSAVFLQVDGGCYIMSIICG